MSFATHTVGRSSSADIQVNHQSVSRLHFEVTQTSTGLFYCIDRNSTCGTFVRKDNKWVTFTQGFLDKDAQLMLGEKAFSLSQLLVSDKPNEAKIARPVITDFEPISVKPRRNTETGEVEKISKSSKEDNR